MIALKLQYYVLNIARRDCLNTKQFGVKHVPQTRYTMHSLKVMDVCLKLVDVNAGFVQLLQKDTRSLLRENRFMKKK